MTGRAVAIQGVLAAAGLLGAFATWQRTPDLQADEVFVLDVTKRDLEKVRYQDHAGWAELVPGQDADGLVIWLRLAGHPAPPPLPSSHPVVAQGAPDREVRGNETALRLWERFAPLRATRSLGVLGPNVLKDLGFEQSSQHLEVTVRGSKRRFTVAAAPPGGVDPYLRSDEDGKVYVVPRSLISDLSSAAVNMTDRRLHTLSMQDVDRLVVVAGGHKKEFVVRRSERGPDVQLLPAGAPDKPDTTAETWHARVFRLFPVEVLGRGETPPGGEPTTVAHVEYWARGRQLGWTELAQRPNGSPASGDGFARSELTAGWFRLAADAAPLLVEAPGIAKP